MNILFIGGTGIISTAISKKLAAEGHNLYLLNRGSRNDIIPDAIPVICDINSPEAEAAIPDIMFDCVADFICFTPEQTVRDFRLFANKCKQYIFISSASAYQKPLNTHIITESTPLCNPYWKYSRDKIDCENYLTARYREDGFPITIIRPSHTYDERSVPLGVHGENGSFAVIKRIMEEKPVIIHGDGTSLWTMTHNSDFAEAFCAIVGNSKAIGEAFHITSDETLTWNEIYSGIAKALDKKLIPFYVSSSYLARNSVYDFEGSLIGDKANSVVFDNSKIKRFAPDFKTKMPFEKGVKLTIDYVLSHSELQKEDPDFDKWCDEIIAKLS
jgi:nucleoside-diphosphate-sugar epimerase